MRHRADSRFPIRDSKSPIADLEFRISNFESRIPNLEFRISNSESRILKLRFLEPPHKSHDLLDGIERVGRGIRVGDLDAALLFQKPFERHHRKRIDNSTGDQRGRLGDLTIIPFLQIFSGLHSRAPAWSVHPLRLGLLSGIGSSVPGLPTTRGRPAHVNRS